MDNNKELNDLLEDALGDLLAGEKKQKGAKEELNVKESLEKITEVTGGSSCSSKSGGDGNFTNSSKKHNNSLEDGLGADEEAMNKFFENMTAQLKEELPKIDPEEARAKINESVPQIFDLMQNLLSKELLYPALTDLSPKFDDWLKKNSPNLSKEDRKRYKQQRDIIKEIIFVFDDESLDNQERFEKNLDLMEKMQCLGSPPDELTVPKGVPGQCSVM